MALDPEEYKQRRAKHEQARNARLRRTRIKLAVAAAVLIAVGILIFIAVQRKPEDPPGQTDPALQTTQASGAEDHTDEATQQTTAAPTETTAPGKVKPDTVIRIAAAGDLNINDAVVAAGGSGLDYSDAFMDIAHLLGDADITALNFEGVLAGPPYGSSGSAPSDLLDALVDAGVDLLQLANSYSIHKGMAGLTSTLSAVRASGLEPLGAYASNDEFRASKGYTIRNIKGVKVAFIAFTKGMNGMALPAGHFTEVPAGVRHGMLAAGGEHEQVLDAQALEAHRLLKGIADAVARALGNVHMCDILAVEENLSGRRRYDAGDHLGQR